MNVFVFFFSTYLWSARQDFSHASSAHCHQEISDLRVMFLNNMDLESKQKLTPSVIKTECTGWNPTGTEANLPIKVRLLVEAKEQMTLKLFP